MDETLLQKIEDSWKDQHRRPTPEEIDSWIEEGRDRSAAKYFAEASSGQGHPDADGDANESLP